MTKEACCWEKTTGIKNPLQISPIGFTGLTKGDFQYFEIAHFANHRNLQKEYLPLFKAITEKLQYLGKFCLERLTTVKQFKLTTSKSSGYGMLPYNLWFVLNHANRDKSGDAQLYCCEKFKVLKPDSNRRYGWSDNGAGRLFADVFKSCARYVPERKVWYVYDGTRHADQCRMG